MQGSKLDMLILSLEGLQKGYFFCLKWYIKG